MKRGKLSCLAPLSHCHMTYLATNNTWTGVVSCYACHSKPVQCPMLIQFKLVLIHVNSVYFAQNVLIKTCPILTCPCQSNLIDRWSFLFSGVSGFLGLRIQGETH